MLAPMDVPLVVQSSAALFILEPSLNSRAVHLKFNVCFFCERYTVKRRL
jgi:hypothetical protein